MTQEEYKAMEMERMAKMNAAPLANQVFKPVRVTQVPPPPRAQEPQITPQQQQPGIGQQFGQALATKMITKGVDAVTGLPIMSSIGLAKGDKVAEPWWKQDIPEISIDDYDIPSEKDLLEEEMDFYDFVDGRRQYKRLSGQERKDLMNTQPDDLSTPETFVYPTSEEGWNQWAKNRPDPRPMPPIRQDPMGPRRPGPRPQAIGPLAQALPPGITSTDMKILQFYGVDPFKASIEDAENYGNLYEHQYGDMEFHPLMNMNRGGDVIFRGGGGSTNNETNWEYAQRTGDIRTPFNNVVFTPEKQGATISYKREDVKPFTWMWNKGRNFLGFGAPLAGGSK